MKTLGYAVVMLLYFAIPVRAAQVYSGCDVPSATSRHAWYVDPVHGKTAGRRGQRFQASPWNSLDGVISGHVGDERFSVSGLHAPASIECSLRPRRQWRFCRRRGPARQPAGSARRRDHADERQLWRYRPW